LDYCDFIAVQVEQRDYVQAYINFLYITLGQHQDKFQVYDYFVESFSSYLQMM